jgi:hypothetical protein
MAVSGFFRRKPPYVVWWGKSFSLFAKISTKARPNAIQAFGLGFWGVFPFFNHALSQKRVKMQKPQKRGVIKIFPLLRK